MEFGRRKRDALLNLSKWYRTLHFSKPERDLLREIIHRSNQRAPWTWEVDPKFGVASTAEHFGMPDRTFRRAVASLTDQGALTVQKISRSHRIYRIPENTIDAIRGVSKRPLRPVRPKESSSLCNENPAPVLGSEDCQPRSLHSYSNSKSSREVEDQRFSYEYDRPQAGRNGSEHNMDDDGPVIGRDPDAPQADPARGTKVTQFGNYFAEQWAKVDCPEARSLNWPGRPWSVNGKVKFNAWVKQVLLPGYDDNLDLCKAMVDVFCAQHQTYFSPYYSSSVYKQFGRKLETLKALALGLRPELSPGVSAEPDEATLERHRLRMERAEATRLKRANPT
jgi:hypothetical protein